MDADADAVDADAGGRVIPDGIEAATGVSAAGAALVVVAADTARSVGVAVGAELTPATPRTFDVDDAPTPALTAADGPELTRCAPPAAGFTADADVEKRLIPEGRGAAGGTGGAGSVGAATGALVTADGVTRGARGAAEGATRVGSPRGGGTRT